jgi:hypothetical protein
MRQGFSRSWAIASDCWGLMPYSMTSKSIECAKNPGLNAPSIRAGNCERQCAANRRRRQHRLRGVRISLKQARGTRRQSGLLYSERVAIVADIMGRRSCCWPSGMYGAPRTARGKGATRLMGPLGQRADPSRPTRVNQRCESSLVGAIRAFGKGTASGRATSIGAAII